MKVKVKAYFAPYSTCVETPVGLFVKNTASSSGGTTYDNWEIRPEGTVVKCGWGDASSTYTVGEHLGEVEMEEGDYASIVADAKACAADWRNCSGNKISMTTWLYMHHIPYWSGINLTPECLDEADWTPTREWWTACAAERALACFRQQRGW